MSKKNIALIFPGQGAQYVGMGQDFHQAFSIYRECFEEAEDSLKKNYSQLCLEGPQDLLTETRNSQVSIFLMSMGIYRVLKEQFPKLDVQVSAGLSLGEYTAITAAGALSFQDGAKLVQLRGQAMHQACEEQKGFMSVVMGLSHEEVEALVQEVNLPADLWAANFNCPGQVVLSGTEKGIQQGSLLAKEKGAKRVLPLTVHGAFHSGLMLSAEEQLAHALESVHFKESAIATLSNATGDFIHSTNDLKKALLKQLTQPVRWESNVRAMEGKGVDLYIEMGPGAVLKGLNKRIGTKAPTVNIERVEDLETFAKSLETELASK
tara:strand:- start:564 stop:1526 length:963 start_codon:yes stop_codon:yes gene_type:complete